MYIYSCVAAATVFRNRVSYFFVSSLPESSLNCFETCEKLVKLSEMTTTQPEVWISSSMIGFMTVWINTSLLCKEFKTRKSGNTTFVTKYLALWSILCIMFGSISILFLTLFNFPGFCYFSLYIYRMFMFAQPLALGFYQLSRLYYCFSRSKIYSSKGYPNWLFIFMFGVAIIWYAMELCIAVDHYVISCGINKTYQLYENRKNLWNSQLSVAVCMGFFLIWDLTTLMLYIYKIRVFTQSVQGVDEKVKDRILSILNKITIITLFYQITALFILSIWFVSGGRNNRISSFAAVSLTILLYSYSMYIMLDHNKKYYEWLLKILYGFRLYFVCYCCCRKRIIQQMDDIRSMKLAMIDDDKKDDRAQIENTNYDTKTNDISINHAKIEIRQELSVETLQTTIN